MTVTYHTGETLRPFLASLRSASVDSPGIVVVDNGSGSVDRERELAAEYDARFIPLRENRGYGSGIAAGVEASEPSEYVLIANPDVVFEPGSIDELVAAADADPAVGAVGPRILDPDGSVYPSARNLPSLGAGVGHAVFGRIWPSNPWSRSYRVEYDNATRARDAGWLSGACLLVRRAAYDQIGGFDPRFFMYFEDVDLGARLGEAGWRNRYQPSSTVMHTGAHSTSRDGSRMAAVHHDSAYLYLSRRYASWYHAPVRLLLRMGLGARKRWVSRS
ncbi:N-acetylglucosaminyl-diphospho-decaprenol L-rhamnosyltransferase [Agromyces sp. 3263]|uniref:glycosyltransferase family 2 protein n=1 Tax=Agromyces sp. 3263 TaxID=2817750 RepID=UPI002859814B|nr:glycosyltransferase family 2 protein [Agromyces sp. 3263]MDR6904652.1 N-acetylglucosaminyl-diphospho-decaprenol L-rhamnosyltransferase [Agromyces sp. 3263]